MIHFKTIKLIKDYCIQIVFINWQYIMLKGMTFAMYGMPYIALMYFINGSEVKLRLFSLFVIHHSVFMQTIPCFILIILYFVCNNQIPHSFCQIENLVIFFPFLYQLTTLYHLLYYSYMIIFRFFQLYNFQMY